VGVISHPLRIIDIVKELTDFAISQLFFISETTGSADGGNLVSFSSSSACDANGVFQNLLRV
jgi:hypothetical protein